MTQTANQRVVREYVQRGHIRQADNDIPTARNRLKVAAYARVSTDEAEQLELTVFKIQTVTNTFQLISYYAYLAGDCHSNRYFITVTVDVNDVEFNKIISIEELEFREIQSLSKFI
jgi:hypothetical protein